MGYESIIVTACVICAACAIISTVISVSISRGVRKQINDGDGAVRDHGERSLAEIRNTVNRIEIGQTRREEQIGELQQSIARIRAASEVDDKHVLRLRDLGGVHDKINKLGNDMAELRGTTVAQHKALHEQLTVVQNTLNEQNRARLPRT